MKKIKTKYTLRSDGRICLTEVINGKRKYFYGSSDREVEDKRDYYKKHLGEIAQPVITFKSVAQLWWDSKERTLSPNTIGGYNTAYNRCVDEFGELPIDKISMQDCIVFLQSFARRDYSQKVISNTRSVLHMIFDYALLNGSITVNPVTGMPVIKGKAKAPRQAAPDSDLAIIEQSKTESNIARMCYFMLYTGARRGEAVALQHKNIDRQNHVAYITQSVAYGSSSAPIIKAPKTAAGFRTIELTDNVLEILPLCDDGEQYVFFPEGLPTRKVLVNSLTRYQRAHGLHSTAHQLRHSYATMLHSAGIDVKDAQYLLGHSTIAMTQDIYTHLDSSHKTAVRKKLNRYIKSRK